MLLALEELGDFRPLISTVSGHLLARYPGSERGMGGRVFHSQEFVPCQGSEVSGVRFTGGRFASYRVRVPYQKLHLRRLAGP